MQPVLQWLLCLFPLVLSKTFVMEMKKTDTLRYLKRTGSLGKYRASQSSVGTQGFTNYYNDYYLGYVTLGTPPQGFYLIMDTGSSDLWVIDKNCNTPNCKGQPASNYTKHQFNTATSTTFKYINSSFSIYYGYGESSGNLGTDVLSFGGFNVTQQTFGVATTLSYGFGFQPVEGIFGLGWPELAVEGVVPPMQNILTSLDKPIFTVFMDMTKSGGRITYGDFDAENCDSQIDYVTLTQKTFWQFPLDKFSIGSYTYNTRKEAISDTGTSWIGTPSEVFIQILNTTGGKFDSATQLATVPCSTDLPPVYLVINGKTYDIPSEEYVLDIGLDDGQCVLTFFAMGYANGLTPSWILGDTFIRSWCNVHDIGNGRIGFAKSKNRPTKKSGYAFTFVLSHIFAVVLFYVAQ